MRLYNAYYPFGISVGPIAPRRAFNSGEVGIQCSRLADATPPFRQDVPPAPARAVPPRFDRLKSGRRPR